MILINFSAIYLVCAFISWDINLFDDIIGSENARICITIIFFLQLFFYPELKLIIKLK